MMGQPGMADCDKNGSLLIKRATKKLQLTDRLLEVRAVAVHALIGRHISGVGGLPRIPYDDLGWGRAI